MAHVIGDTLLASFILGAYTGAKPLKPPPGPPDSPIVSDYSPDDDSIHYELIKRAANSLARKKVFTKSDYERLTDQAKVMAFTAAGIATEDALEKIQTALVESLESGEGVRGFRSKVEERLGKSALGRRQIENIYRTNTALAYSDGMDQITERVKDVLPFVVEEIIHDSRTSEICRLAEISGIQGTNIYLVDDPEYQRIRSPRHFQCRCSRRLASVTEAADLGIRYAKEWLRLGKQPKNPPHVSTRIVLPKGWIR